MEIKLYSREYRYRELFGAVFKEAYKQIIEQSKLGELPWRDQFSEAASQTHAIIKKFVEKGDIARYGKEPFPLVELWYRDPEYPYVRFLPTKGRYNTLNSYFTEEWIEFIYTLSVQTRNKNGSTRHVEIHVESVCDDAAKTIEDVQSKVDADTNGVALVFVKEMNLEFVTHTAYSSSFEFRFDAKIDRPEEADFKIEYYDYDMGEVRATASGMIKPPEWWNLPVDVIWSMLVTSSKLGKSQGPMPGQGQAKLISQEEKYARADLTVAKMHEKLQDKPEDAIQKMIREAQEKFIEEQKKKKEAK